MRSSDGGAEFDGGTIKVETYSRRRDNTMTISYVIFYETQRHVCERRVQATNHHVAWNIDKY